MIRRMVIPTNVPRGKRAIVKTQRGISMPTTTRGLPLTEFLKLLRSRSSENRGVEVQREEQACQSRRWTLPTIQLGQTTGCDLLLPTRL